ncbi:MAG: hypothetical protein ACO29O_09095, partial [Chitinophagaceae bacterium]
MKILSIFFILLFSLQLSRAQQKDTIDGRIITLAEVVVNSKTNIRGFMDRVMSDTSFYKAFRNLRILEFSALNDIRMMDKQGKAIASSFSKTKQLVSKSCRHTEKISENVSGKFYDKKGEY